MDFEVSFVTGWLVWMLFLLIVTKASYLSFQSFTNPHKSYKKHFPAKMSLRLSIFPLQSLILEPKLSLSQKVTPFPQNSNLYIQRHPSMITQASKTFHKMPKMSQSFTIPQPLYAVYVPHQESHILWREAQKK